LAFILDLNLSQKTTDAKPDKKADKKASRRAEKTADKSTEVQEKGKAREGVSSSAVVSNPVRSTHSLVQSETETRAADR
jgi:hypothetical protein